MCVTKPCEEPIEALHINPLLLIEPSPKTCVIRSSLCLYPHSVAYPYISSSTFSAGSGPIFLSGLNCLGTERTLLDCSSYSWDYPYHYSHGSDVWMRCEHSRYHYSGELSAPYHHKSRNYCHIPIIFGFKELNELLHNEYCCMCIVHVHIYYANV